MLDLQMYAFSRLFLRGQINNLQTSWVKLGADLRCRHPEGRMQRFLRHSDGRKHHREAGGTSGEFVSVDLIEEKAREMGRVAVERSTTYKKLYGKRLPMARGQSPQISRALDHHACGGSGGR